MLTTDQITRTVLREIRTVLEEAGGPVEVGWDDRLEDVGLDSLRLARLMIVLEAELGVDPFTPEEGAHDGSDGSDGSDVVDVFDVGTVGRFVEVYVTALGARSAVAGSA